MSKELKPIKKEKIKEAPESTEGASQSLLKSFLKDNEKDHYNFEDPVVYTVPSGSFLLDYKLEGGLCPGLHRFTGIMEGGKTSQACQFLKNFLDKEKKAKGVYVKSEGRLSENIQARSGVKFVFNEEEWVDGTCFVFESNIYETVASLFRDLVHNNPEKNKYFFILDSVDGLMLKGDVDKTFEESNKVAGGAVVASVFMKKCALSLQKRGHIAIFISQVRSDIKLDPYSKTPVRITNASGGNSLYHYANWILEFEARFNKDLILEDPAEKYDEESNKIIGHFARITVKKSPNEKTNSIVRYPIRYGRVGGTSNWLEKEIFDFLSASSILVKKGAWIAVDEDLLAAIKEAGIEDFPTQIQGVAKFEKLLEDPKIMNFLSKYVKEQVNECVKLK